jgi:hypothetical protein
MHITAQGRVAEHDVVGHIDSLKPLGSQPGDNDAGYAAGGLRTPLVYFRMQMNDVGRQLVGYVCR